MKFKIGIIISFTSLLVLCFFYINEGLTSIEKIVMTIFFFIITAIGLLIEKNYFPIAKESFDESRKF